MLESKNSEYDIKKYCRKELAFQPMPTDYAVDHLVNVKLSWTVNTDESRSCEHPSEGTRRAEEQRIEQRRRLHEQVQTFKEYPWKAGFSITKNARAACHNSLSNGRVARIDLSKDL